MIFLGFADDVIDLRWRHKWALPSIAGLPLLMVYWVNYNSTTIALPQIVYTYLGIGSIDIGAYVF
jgi:UDP-N-acetylglucosamine--dolichyl-phosphate N-acetylglucosaminephosphotransferase